MKEISEARARSSHDDERAELQKQYDNLKKALNELE